VSQEPRQRYALQTIFSFFLGLMVAALVGVGVNTFYKSPEATYQKRMTAISRQLEDFNTKRSGTATLTPAESARLDALNAEQRSLQDRQDGELKVWARNTSIIVIVFATLVMALSLLRSEQLKVISNGLLLGGLFTMIYGTGWIIASGDSLARFFVMVFALAVSLGLGYLKFVRNREAAAESSVSSRPASEEMGDLEARVSALEARAAAAAAALGGEGEHSQTRSAG
jgi:hypothetical protein